MPRERFVSLVTLASLATPPVRRIVPDGVFDAFGWCASDRLGWGFPAAGPLDLDSPITSANPPGMAFVVRDEKQEELTYLPRELASLHLGGMGFAGEWVLAPWGIDDATDLLYAHRATPGEHLWLATASLAGLFWGLHDWAHFHNHGPFEERAWTELQCDAAALAWAWLNREVIGLSDATWERARTEVAAVGAARFAEESLGFDGAWLAADRLRALVAGG